MRQKLKVGDKVILSSHGTRVSGKSMGISEKRWTKATQRSTKDVYIVDEVLEWAGLVQLGRREGGWFKSEEGLLSGRWVRRDWIKLRGVRRR